MSRGNGILLHISSLPSARGYGSLGKPAYIFVDFLKHAGQGYWQILPCSPPGQDGSPYKSYSGFAGNPHFIDVDLLLEDGLLEERDLQDFHIEKLDFLLHKAYKAGYKRFNNEFTNFKYENAFWLFDYSLYMAEKKRNGWKPLVDWEQHIAARQPEEMVRLAQESKEEIECIQFIQFLYQKQWWALKNYSNQNGVRLIGEIPFYIQADSADAWAFPDNLILDGSYVSLPPWAAEVDVHIDHNPPYNWNHMADHGYDWWMARIRHWENMFDHLMIDHMADLLGGYVVKPGEKSAKPEAGAGYAFNDTLCYHLPDVRLLAGDTELLQDEAEFLRNCGFIRVKALQHAFGGDARNEHLPHNYERESLCTTALPGDNTTRGWYMGADAVLKKRMQDYFGTLRADTVATRVIRTAMGSIANICIIPMTDFLNLTAEARYFDPVQGRGNFTWEMHESDLSSKEADKLKSWTKTYGRY